MFKEILIPISSEFYQKEVFEIGAFLAETFDSEITLVYIIEEKALDQADKMSDTYRSQYDREETKKEIVSRHIRTAGNIIFDDAHLLFKNRNVSFKEEIIEGLHELKEEIRRLKGSKTIRIGLHTMFIDDFLDKIEEYLVD